MIDTNQIEISEMSLQDFILIKNTLSTSFDDFWNEETLLNELKNENSYYLVAKINNDIVGFAGIKIVLDEADIMNIVVKKCLRNIGIGSSLINKIIDYANNNGIKKITLEVNENNQAAIHLYRKFRFKEIAVREKYYDKTYNAIIMQICL